MNVRAEQEHLASPILSTVNKFGVSIVVCDPLVHGIGEGMGSGSGDVNAQGICGVPNRFGPLAQISYAARHCLMDARGNLNGVEEHFLLDEGFTFELLNDELRCLAQIV